MHDGIQSTFRELIDAGHLQVGDGYRTKQAEHGHPGLPILRVSEVLDGRIHPKFEDFVSTDYRRAMGPKVSQAGDIVLTTKGTVGRVAIIPPENPEFVYSPQVCFFRITPTSPLVRQYLYYWFKSQQFWSQARSLKGQTDMADYINLADIRSLSILLPSKRVQQSVAAALGALDDKITVNKKVAVNCNELMTALYARASIQGVMRASIGKVADVFDGPHATPRKTESGPWFLSISSLEGGRLVLSESAHLSDADFQRWTRRVEPRPGDLLFSYETRLGEAALMPAGIQACLGRRMALLRSRNDVVGSRTLLQAFLSRSFQQQIRQLTIHGATVDRISLTSLPSWPIDLPAHGTRQLEDSLSQLDELAGSRERENEKLVALRDALLPGLMSGRVRVGDLERTIEGAT